MISSHFYRVLLVLALTLLVNTLAFANSDALKESSVKSLLAPHSLILDIQSIRNLVIAVGERGFILRSTDNGNSWQQSNVPVRVTLTSSYFVNKKCGWAVGHDGVVLRTRDGGKNWQKILDGYQANQLMYQLAKQQVTEQLSAISMATGSERTLLEKELEKLQYDEDDALTFVEEGASRPFLDVWFKNENEGFVIGALGLFLKTSDGGDSWTSWADHIDNTDLFHLNSISKISNKLFITGEAGTLFVSDDYGNSWNSLTSPYKGSFFGITGKNDKYLVLHGLRGNAFISFNKGASWKKIATQSNASIYGSALLSNDKVILVGGSGVILLLDEQGKLLSKRHNVNNLPISAVVSLPNNNMMIAGFGGIKEISLSQSPSSESGK